MRKEDYDDIKSYKDYPEGSVYKQIYDKYYLPFQKFLTKYYKKELKAEDNWYYFTGKFVKPLFNGTPWSEYWNFLYQVKPSFCPNPEKLARVWEIQKKDERFDDELNHFFAFVQSCNFLEEWKIDFETFLQIDNWMHPWYTEEHDNMKSILEILQYKHGINFLKTYLALSPWLRV